MLLELTTSAETEIADAALAYERERAGLGFRFEEEVDHTLSRIAEGPLQFPVVSAEVRRALVRVFPYSVFFTIVGDRARVFAVLHQHRHPHTWRGRSR